MYVLQPFYILLLLAFRRNLFVVVVIIIIGIFIKVSFTILLQLY